MLRAAVVFHERDHDLGVRNVGSFAPVLRERDIETTTFTFEADAAAPPVTEFDMVVLMGSPDAAYDDSLPWLAGEIEFVEAAVAQQVPILGVCFGGQLLARVLGGTVSRAATSENGFFVVDTLDPALVPEGPWLESHDDTFTLPPGARPVACTAAALQAFVSGPHLGVQFHPEITADVFDSWVQGWEARGVRAEVEAGMDVAAMRAEIVLREDASRRACGDLVDAFLVHAGLSRPVQPRSV